ncbi:MAG: hypothetical protein E7328_04405 [Clostridiales bacterium]|nr:hypothetical protein [Clostridiales bacterium]
MDFSLIRSAFADPFEKGEQNTTRALVYLVLGVALALFPRVQMGEGLYATLGDTLLYLCIYTLPFGYSALAYCLPVLIGYAILGNIPVGISFLIVRLVAMTGAKALLCCNTMGGHRRLVLPIAWAGLALLVGSFCYESVFCGVDSAVFNLLIRLAEWALCAMLAMGIIAFTAQKREKLPKGLLDVLGL